MARQRQHLCKRLRQNLSSTKMSQIFVLCDFNCTVVKPVFATPYDRVSILFFNTIALLMDYWQDLKRFGQRLLSWHLLSSIIINFVNWKNWWRCSSSCRAHELSRLWNIHTNIAKLSPTLCPSSSWRLYFQLIQSTTQPPNHIDKHERAIKITNFQNKSFWSM